MLLIDQNHDVKLSIRNRVQIYLHQEKYPIPLPIPNYHLFASSAKSKTPKDIITSTAKTKIPLELLYMQMGCRNIKTLLSVNQAELWKDITVVISNDIISENYHHIATIKKANRNMTREPNPKLKPGDVICLDIIQNISRTSLTPSTMYKYFLLAYRRIPKIKGLYAVSTSEIIDVLKFIQVQLYNLKFHTELHLTSRIQADFGTVFTLNQFQQFCLNNKFKLFLASPKHLKINSIHEHTYQSITLIKNSLLVQAHVDLFWITFCMRNFLHHSSTYITQR